MRKGQHVRRRGRGALQAQRAGQRPLPPAILCPADGVEPVDGVLPDLGFLEGCCDARQSCLNPLFNQPGTKTSAGGQSLDACASSLPFQETFIAQSNFFPSGIQSLHQDSPHHVCKEWKHPAK